MKNLTAYNEANAREIEMMVGKAMCAWANWQTAIDNPYSTIAQTAYKSEYEATVRCIDMFVRESLYEVQAYIIECAVEMISE